MIANARMYSVTPAVGQLWRRLFTAIAQRAGVAVDYVEHVEPAPISELWRRPDKAAVFMCGLPFARSEPRPTLIAAPVPSAAGFQGRPEYWSELVVRRSGGARSLEETFGGRIALTSPESQSGCLAALYYLMHSEGRRPLYGELIAPRITPLGALMAVIEGSADVAPIDSFAFALLQRYRPELTSEVLVVARTGPTAIPPIVASSSATGSARRLERSAGGLERSAGGVEGSVGGVGPPLGIASLETAFSEAHNDPMLGSLLADLQVEKFVRPEPRHYDVLRQRFDESSEYWHRHPFAARVHPGFARLVQQAA